MDHLSDDLVSKSFKILLTSGRLSYKARYDMLKLAYKRWDGLCDPAGIERLDEILKDLLQSRVSGHLRVKLTELMCSRLEKRNKKSRREKDVHIEFVESSVPPPPPPGAIDDNL